MTADCRENYDLQLFIADEEYNSQLAQKNLEEICENHLKGRCRVEITDVLTDFETALKHRVIVTPTLLVMKPEPRTTVVGNLSDRQKVLAALRLI